MSEIRIENLTFPEALKYAFLGDLISNPLEEQSYRVVDADDGPALVYNDVYLSTAFLSGEEILSQEWTAETTRHSV